MKKTISLLLALVMCLSLCACGGGNDTPETKGNEENNAPTESQVETTDAPEATEDPAIEAEREKQYNTALTKLETSMFNSQSAAFKEAYEILSQLGDYKDAQAYLARFTIIPNVCLMETHSKANAFGEEEYSYSIDYGYNADGKVAYDAKGCSDSIDPQATRTIYTYKEGLVIEEVRVMGTMTDQKVSITYDELGNAIQKDYLNADGTTSTQTFTYDDMGRLTTMMWVESNFIYEYTYDDNGVLIRVVGEGNHATETTEYSYDTDGNLVNESITLKVPGAKQFSSKSYFYENGNLVRVEENSEQNGLVVITYTYGDYYCYTPEN